jgi:ribosomal protein L37E
MQTHSQAPLGKERPVDTVIVDSTSWGEHDHLIRGQRWTVVNAPRPLPGRLTWQGPFRRGVFYAAGPKAEYLNAWQAADATEVRLADPQQVLEQLRARIRGDGYDPVEVLADPAAFGFSSVEELAREYGLPAPPSTPQGHEGGLMDVAAYGVPDPSDLYVRCPQCGRVAQPLSMDYVLVGGPGSEPDETHPVQVRCQICHQPFDGRGRWVTADSQITCARCGERSPAAHQAVRARCCGCGLFNFGPAAATPADGRRLAAVEAFEQRQLLHRAIPERLPDPAE